MLALVVNGPMPSEYLDAKKKVVPFSHLTTSQEDIMKKFDAWEAKLAPDDAKGCENNRANFNMVKEAFLKKTALPIYIQSDKKKRAVKGAQIQIPGEGTTDVTMICNKERLLGVVATKLSGVIPTTGDRTLGCRLNWSAPNSKAGQTNSGKPVLKIANRIAALEDDKVILLNKVKTVAGKVVTEKNAKAVRVDVAFKVIGKQRPNSTTPTYTTVRVSGGYSDYPVFERASAEMIKEFGDLHSDPNVINIPTGQDLAKQIENIQNTYAYFVRSGNALKFGVRDAVREIQTAVAPAKNDDLDM